MKAFLAVVLISLTVALLPRPRITVQNPNLLYAAAMYETAVGDTDSALRFVQRAEQAKKSIGAAHPSAGLTSSHRSAIFTIL
jgi:hypothetical protein